MTNSLGSRRAWAALGVALASVCLWQGSACIQVLPPGGVLPGSSFATAAALPLDSGGQASISGTIVGSRIDVYDLGPAADGDRIEITVSSTLGSALDPLAAVFTANEELYWINDDRNLGANDLDSDLDFLVRTASSKFYLAVTRSRFGATSGGYAGTVKITRGVGAPAPAVQYLLLDFSGGSIMVPNVGNYNLTAFDAADIDSAYTGKTNQIKAQIIAVVKDRFSAYGIEIVSSDDPPPPAGCYSTLFFGGFSSTAFGMSENVDHGNEDGCDDGVVFTIQFSDPFASLPSVTGIGTAIGNVAAHEAGHLLGLEHTADITDLMDTTGSASTLLANQIFKTAVLDGSIFPIGKQNSPLLLNEVIPP